MKYLSIIFLLVVLSSCVNFTNIKSARTLPPNKTKDHFVYTRFALPESGGEIEGVILVPEFVFVKKLKKNLDWGVKLGLDAKVNGNLKYQFIGNYNSKFAVSLLPEIGIGFMPGGQKDVYSVPLSFQAELPLLITYHFTDEFFITTAPKVLDYMTPDGNLTMLAWSTGLQFGKKVNWTLAYSYFYLAKKPLSSNVFFDKANVFEIGIKFNMFKNGRTFAARI